jgi:hypothetical protein
MSEQPLAYDDSGDALTDGANPGQENAAKEESADERYLRFLRGLELRTIRLKSAQVENLSGAQPADRLVVTVLRNVLDKTTDSAGFHADIQYDVVFGKEDAPSARIAVVYTASYDAKAETTDAMINRFAKSNIPLNTWPFLREFIAGMLGRMGWETLNLPLLIPSDSAAERG